MGEASQFPPGMPDFPGFSGFEASEGDPAPDPLHQPTLFEWAGGYPALLGLTRIFYSRYVPEDPLLGPLFAKMSPDHPERVAGLILFASLAKGSATPDYPHALRRGQYEIWLRQLVAEWGGPAGIETFAPSLAGDPQARAWWAGLLRAASSPGAIKGLLEALRDMDVRPLLGRVSAATLVMHRRGDRAVLVGAGRHLASHIRRARFVELDGADHWAFAGDQRAVLDSVRQVVGDLAK
jgi:hypothetical protein